MRGFFDHFFSYLKASNCCGEPSFRHAPSSTFLVCKHLCPWQDCADMQARLSLRWLHVISWTDSFHRQPNVKHDAEACINHFSSWFVRLCVRVMIHRNHLMCKTHNTISWGRRARLISVVFDKKFHRIYNVYSYFITLIACAFWWNLEM